MLHGRSSLGEAPTELALRDMPQDLCARLGATEGPRAGATGLLRRVGDADLAGLQAVLDEGAGEDPYQLSAGYFALTGRHGLWLARSADSALVVCRHPQHAGTMLVFPPLGTGGMDLLAAALQRLAAPRTALRLARAGAAFPVRLAGSALAAVLCRVPETDLDWAFPVHVLDPAAVAAHRGGAFEAVRRGLNWLDHAAIEALDLRPGVHAAAVLDLVGRWAAGDPDRIAPYRRLLGLFGTVPLAGRLVLHAGRPAGFSAWDEAPRARGLANAFAHIGLHEVRGMARFVLYDMCRTLAAKGFAEACIGGSETSGLDRFKRKFAPVRSIRLDTWEAVPAAAAASEAADS
jgi:hypothetical protein